MSGSHHQCGATTTRSVAAPTAAITAARATANTAPVSRTGTTHTQWCEYETGDTSSPPGALRPNAHVGHPAANARRIPRAVSPTVAAAGNGHGRPGSTPNRTSITLSDWSISLDRPRHWEE